VSTAKRSTSELVAVATQRAIRPVSVLLVGFDARGSAAGSTSRLVKRNSTMAFALLSGVSDGGMSPPSIGHKEPGRCHFSWSWGESNPR
jgi:hypothetical protein